MSYTTDKLQKLEGKEIQEIEQEAENIRAVFNNLNDYYNLYVYPTWTEVYKKKRLYTGDRAAKLKQLNRQGRSNIMYPLICSIHDTYFSNTYDTKTSIRAIPTNDDDYEEARTAQDYVTRAMQVSKGDSVIKVVDEEAILIGVGYARVGFEITDKTKTYMKNGIEVSKKIKKSIPTISYVDPYSLLFDPKATDFYTAPKFYRTIMPVYTAISRYKDLTSFTDEEFEDLYNNPAQYFSSQDPAAIRQLKAYDKLMQTIGRECNEEITKDIQDRIKILSSNEIYNIDYKSGLVEVVEYFESDKLVLFINGYVVYYGVNPYPIDGDPFVRMIFKEEPGTMFPDGLGQKLLPLQTTVDAFINNWIDTINNIANPAFIADKAVFGADTPEILHITPGKVLERIAGKTIETLKITDPSATNNLLSGINFAISQAYEIAGLNSYTQGGSGKVERTAGGVDSRVQVLKTALVPFFNNKNNTLGEIAERWQYMGLVYLDKDFKANILGDDGEVTFSKIDITDLENGFYYMYDNQSLKTIAKTEERQDIIMALQSIQDPNTKAVLEKKLLDTFSMKPLTEDDKKQIIKENVGLQTYQQSLLSTNNNSSQVANGQLPATTNNPQDVASEAVPSSVSPDSGNNIDLASILKRPKMSA